MVFVFLSLDSSPPAATAMPGEARGGSRVVAGEAVDAEDGTGFLFTTSDLGTVIFGRVAGGGGGAGLGLVFGGSRGEISSREGRPRFIILVHFSGESGRRVRSSLFSQARYSILRTTTSGAPNSAVIGARL